MLSTMLRPLGIFSVAHAQLPLLTACWLKSKRYALSFAGMSQAHAPPSPPEPPNMANSGA
jgi:hypothetical protein